MGAVGESVLIFPGDPVALGNILGGDAHADVDVGIGVDQVRIGRKIKAGHRHGAHRFRAACDNRLHVSGEDRLNGHGDGLQSRGAETVDGRRRHAVRQPGSLSDDSSHVHALLALRHGAADQHIIDLVRSQAGHFRQGAFHCGGAEILRAHLAEGAALGFPHRSAHAADDVCVVLHEVVSCYSKRSNTKKFVNDAGYWMLDKNIQHPTSNIKKTA